MPEHTPGGAALNTLLAALPADVNARLEPHLESASLALGEVIYEANDALTHVYFPTSAIVSLLYTMEDGTSAEMGVVGCDGVVGIAVFMGGDTTPSRAIVQSAGDAMRLEVKYFRDEYKRVGDAVPAVVTLYANPADPVLADRCLQQTALCQSAALPLSSPESRPD